MTHRHRTRGGLIIDDQRIPTYTRALFSANPLLALLYPYVAAPYATVSGPPLTRSACPTLTPSTTRRFVWSLRIKRPTTSAHCPATRTSKGLNRTFPSSRHHVKLKYGFSGRNPDCNTHATGRQDYHGGPTAACPAPLRAFGSAAFEGGAGGAKTHPVGRGCRRQ
jgi:hypothetical protein